MKKVLYSLLLITLLFSITACTKKESNNQETITTAQRLVYDGVNYELDQIDSYKNLEYRVSSNFEKKNYGTSIGYFSKEVNNEPSFIIRLFYYNDRTIKDIMIDLNEEEVEYNTMAIDGKEFIAFKIGNNADVYVYNKGKESYVLTFLSKYDISDLKHDMLINVN